MWQWDFTNATCEGAVAYPGPLISSARCETENTLDCKVRSYVQTCSLNGSTYEWTPDYSNYSCTLPEGRDCDLIGFNYGSGVFCSEQCKKKKCPEGSVYNKYGHTCYAPVNVTGDVVFYTRKSNPSRPPLPNGQGTTCGPNDNRCKTTPDTYVYCPTGNATGYECRNNYTCPNSVGISRVNTTPSEYCRTADNPTKAAFNSAEAPVVTGRVNMSNPQGCSGTVNYWRTGFAYDILKCQSVTPINP